MSTYEQEMQLLAEKQEYLEAQEENINRFMEDLRRTMNIPEYNEERGV